MGGLNHLLRFQRIESITDRQRAQKLNQDIERSDEGIALLNTLIFNGIPQRSCFNQFESMRGQKIHLARGVW